MTFLSQTQHVACKSPRSRMTLGHLIAVYRSRQQLSALDDRALKDICLTREAAEREAQRPAWDLPHTWGR